MSHTQNDERDLSQFSESKSKAECFLLKRAPKQTVLVVLGRYLREFFSTPLRYDRNIAAIYGK